MAKNNSEEIDFQQYVDSVKQKRIDWNLFVNVIKDISYSDKDRLRILNATLLNELTLDHNANDFIGMKIFQKLKEAQDG